MASTARPTTVMPIVAAGELIGSASIVEKHAKGDEDRGGAAAVAAAAGGAGAGGGTGVAAAGGRSTTSYDSDDASEREGGDSLPSSSGSSLQSTSDSDTRSFAPRNVVRSKRSDDFASDAVENSSQPDSPTTRVRRILPWKLKKSASDSSVASLGRPVTLTTLAGIAVALFLAGSAIAAGCQAESRQLGPRGIGDEGVRHLSDALARGAAPALKLLTLNGNEIGDNGAHHLADALARGAAPALEWLDLRENEIGDEGMRRLGDALANGAAPALKTLILERNPASMAATQAAMDAFENRPK